MTRNRAVAFVVGFVVGAGILLIALAVAPGVVGAGQPGQPRQRQVLPEETAAVLDRLNRWLDEGEVNFVNPARYAKELELLSTLESIRSQIELFRMEHSMYPGRIRKADGTFTDWSGATFVAQMVNTTDVNGDSNGSGYGPYYGDFPPNPFADRNADDVAAGERPCPGDGSTGWYWDTDDFTFLPNDLLHKGPWPHGLGPWKGKLP